MVSVMKRAARLRIRRIRTRHDFLQIQISTELTVQQAVSTLDRDRRILIYSVLQSPYLDETLNDEFLSCDLVSVFTEPCKSAEGLLCAQIVGVLAISFANGGKWNTNAVNISFRRMGMLHDDAVVPHASREEHVASTPLVRWAARRLCSALELVPTGDRPLPNIAFSDQLVSNWAAFYQATVKLAPAEKTARLREMASDVAHVNGYDHCPHLSATNSKASGALRQIFVSAFTRHGHEFYLSTDFEKAAGAFESCDRNGRHLGEWLFSGQKNAEADNSGHHDIIIN